MSDHSDDLEILPNEQEPPPPEGIYARVAQDAELEIVVRVCAVDMAADLSGVTKENIVPVARDIAEFILTGAAPRHKRSALAIVKNDSDA